MTTELATRPQNGAAFNSDQLALIKRTVAKDADNDELALFLYTAQSRGLDPLLKQIHAVSRYDSDAKRKTMSIQVGIDGYRLIADRTGVYAGNDDAVFRGEGDYPDSATVTVYKFVQGMRCGFTATARWTEYYPGDRQGFMWRKMPHTMLGKCAEALALRKAFPAEMSGLYIHEEMQQAGPSVVDNEQREAALAEWQAACQEAAGMGVEHKDLPDNATLAQINRWTIALNQKINAVHDAQAQRESQEEF